MSDIEEIASKHLGKTADGHVSARYVTPDAVDPSLLVAIPRSLNRTQYHITNPLPFVGCDVWHAYELSFLTPFGVPVNCVAKIVYPATTTNIVESKSLKLYLNTYNNSRHKDAYEVADMISEHLLDHVGIEATVLVLPVSQVSVKAGVLPGNFIDLDAVEPSYAFSHYQRSIHLLERTEGYESTASQYRFHSSALRSNCRVTNQPDWGDVYIVIDTKWRLRKEAILEYIVSFRNENHFHEEVCEVIYNDLFKAYEPGALLVGCLYTRRGGIDINPIRANAFHMISHHLGDLSALTKFSTRTPRQ